MVIFNRRLFLCPSVPLGWKGHCNEEQREIIATEQELKNLEQQCRETDTSISATLKQAGSKMQEVGSKITEVGTGLTTHVTASIVAVGAASLAAFNEVDAGLDTVASSAWTRIKKRARLWSIPNRRKQYGLFSGFSLSEQISHRL